MAMRGARLAVPPELVELDEYFFVATELMERSSFSLSLKSESARDAAAIAAAIAPGKAGNSAG